MCPSYIENGHLMTCSGLFCPCISSVIGSSLLLLDDCKQNNCLICNWESMSDVMRLRSNLSCWYNYVHLQQTDLVRLIMGSSTCFVTITLPFRVRCRSSVICKVITEISAKVSLLHGSSERLVSVVMADSALRASGVIVAPAHCNESMLGIIGRLMRSASWHLGEPIANAASFGAWMLEISCKDIHCKIM